MAPARIKCYIDCVSVFSVFAFFYLRKRAPLLKQHGVDVEFIPFFLGGLNGLTGNKPPITLPAKAKHMRYDLARASKYFEAPIKTPEPFPFLSLLPQRCLVYIKEKYPNDKFEDAYESIIRAIWQESKTLTGPDGVAEVLAREFSQSEVEEILRQAGSDSIKQKLSDVTKELAEKGAYGAPWLIVTNKAGITEPFFGSDRFHYIWDFLGLPYQKLELLAPRANL